VIVNELVEDGSDRDRWHQPTVNEFVGDELYQYGSSGAPVALTTGSPFDEWSEVFWSRIDVTMPRSHVPPIGRIPDELYVGPRLRIRIVVAEGRPQIEELELMRSANCGEISPNLLADIPFTRIVDHFVVLIGRSAYLSHWALAQIEAAGARRDVGPGSAQSTSMAGSDDPNARENDEVRKQAVLARAEDAGLTAARIRQRRAVTHELLEEVARIYLADESGAPTRAVSGLLFTSHRNATRWVAEARSRGLIPEYWSRESREENEQ